MSRNTCDRCGKETESPLRTLCKKCWWELEDELGYPRTPYVTNAMKIRAMTDEELAYFLEGTHHDPWNACGRCRWSSCEECCLEWLKEEVKT